MSRATRSWIAYTMPLDLASKEFWLGGGTLRLGLMALGMFHGRPLR